jgi:hypothetical protein
VLITDQAQHDIMLQPHFMYNALGLLDRILSGVPTGNYVPAPVGMAAAALFEKYDASA